MNLPDLLRELETQISAGRIEKARSIYDKLRMRAGESQMFDEYRSILGFHGAAIDFIEGNYKSALAGAECALNTFRQSGNRWWIAKCHLLLCGILLRISDYRRAEEHAQAAAYFFTWEIKDSARRSEAYDKLGTVKKNLGSWDIAEESYRKALLACQNTGDPLPNLRSSLNLAILLRKKGKIDEASDICKEGLYLSKQYGIELAICRFALELANIDVLRQDATAGFDHLATAARIANCRRYPRERVLFREVKGDLLSARGDHDIARKAYSNALDLMRELGLGGDLEYEILRRMAAASLTMADTDRAKDLVSSAIEIVRDCEDTYEYGICLRILGLANIESGMEGAGISNLRESVGIMSRLSGWSHELGLSEIALGKALAGSAEYGGSIRALEHVLNARRIFSGLGLNPHVEKIDKWIQEESMMVTSQESRRIYVRESAGGVGGHDIDLARYGLITGDERIVGDVSHWGGTDVRVLIEGETGVGKELVARTLHALGHRREHRFVAVDCGALSETLADSELFGHVRGSFTGAFRDRMGLIEEANGGTLLLDEIGELSEAVQAKLLRVLEDGELRRVGDNKVRRVDIRVISATTRDLGQAVEDGRFRRDLYYRLKGALIRVPSLRERRGDIDLLLDHFLAIECERCGREISLSEGARERLCEYSWPGNVRELRSTVEALAVSVGEDGEISVGMVERFMPGLGRGSGLDGWEKAVEREEIERALSACNGNKSKAARMLGITRRTLYSKLKKD